MACQLRWPPALPEAQHVVTDRSGAFLRAPDGVELRPGTTVARTAPTIDFLYFGGQDHPGKPWSVWGDGLAVGESRYYTAIGDHLAPGGTAQLYEYDAETQRLRQLVDLRGWLTESGELPEGMQYTPAKVHSRIDLGRDGWLYYSTHRGSTRDATTDARGYRGDWIFRTHPATAATEIAARYPVAKHTIPASVLDRDRMIYYGGTQPGNDAEVQDRLFLAWDLIAGRALLQAPGGFLRYAILSPRSGRVFWNGRVYDPQTNALRDAPEAPEPRCATEETADGVVYGTSGHSGEIWAFDTGTERLTIVGESAPGEHGYTTAMVLDPHERYLYYVPGGHGGIADEGTPIVQFDLLSKTRKVIAFVAPHYRERYGYTPDGTFSLGLSAGGDTLFITWNGNRVGASGSKHWDACAMMAVHIPASERRP